MRQIFSDSKTWRWVAGTLFAILLAGPLGNRLWGWPNIWPVVGIALIIAVLIAVWRRHVEQRLQTTAANIRAFHEEQARIGALRQQFDLCKPVAELRPSDFGFQVLERGEAAEPGPRPYYPLYVPRTIVPLESAEAGLSTPAFTESMLADELKAGRSFVLHGPPTMGKSRTIFKIISLLEGWLVIRPRKDAPVPSEEVFATLLAGKNVIVALEDLNDFAGTPMDWTAFCGPSRLGTANRWAIAATCRDGPELGVVKEAVASPLRRFYDDIPLKLTLLPQTSEEKAAIARSAGIADWDPKLASAYPTPGAIVMERSLRYMRARFEELSGEQRDTLYALRLLIAGGILPLTHQRILATLETVFHRHLRHLVDVLQELGDFAFLHAPARRDPVLPEPAYLGDAVVQGFEGRTPAGALALLRDALEKVEDDGGLDLLGYTFSMELGDYEAALASYDAALRIRPDDATTLGNKGAVLGELGRLEEALAVFDASLLLRGGNPHALYNKGNVLRTLGRHEEALTSYDACLRLRPDYARAHANRGFTLHDLGRYEEALAAHQASLQLRPDDPDTLSNKGVTLDDLGRHEEALAAHEASLQLLPLNPKALNNKGTTLGEMGRHEEALAMFDASLQIRPDDPETLNNKAVTLGHLGRHEEALAMFDAILQIRPAYPSALNNKGNELLAQGRYEEALAAYDESLRIRPEHAAVLTNRGIALAILSRLKEGKND